jgi:hypothetical protein
MTTRIEDWFAALPAATVLSGDVFVKQGAAIKRLPSTLVGNVASTTVTAIVVLTAAAYAALGTKDATTLYLIVG